MSTEAAAVVVALAVAAVIMAVAVGLVVRAVRRGELHIRLDVSHRDTPPDDDGA